MVLLAVSSQEFTVLDFDLWSYVYREGGDVRAVLSLSLPPSHRSRTMEPFCARATNHKQSLIINSLCSVRLPGSTAPSWLQHVTLLQQMLGFKHDWKEKEGQSMLCLWHDLCHSKRDVEYWHKTARFMYFIFKYTCDTDSHQPTLITYLSKLGSW